MPMNPDEIKIIIENDVKDVLESEQQAQRKQQQAYLKQKIADDAIAEKEKAKLIKELRKQQRDDDIKAAKDQFEKETDYEKKRQKELHLKELEHQKELEEHQEELEERKKKNAQQLAHNVAKVVLGAVDRVYASIGQAAQTYSSYVDRIQVRLLGANETVGSISNTLSRAFGASPFFQMKNVMEKAAQFVEKGINFNIEQRAAMQVLADKVAATFDAFDASVLRLVRIQQEDSTRARLGMESMLTEFLNRNFQDSSYLADNINSTVTQALVEMESLYNREQSMQLEYSIQKYLSSLYSVGVSQNLVNTLAQGLGYLASGDVTSLSGNTALETLLVTMANRGGADYGAILTGGATVDNISAMFSGLRSLVDEISKNSTNIVALNQYAKVFGMTVSDVQSLINLSDNAMKEIANDMQSYSNLTQRVLDESSFSKLFSRSGGATIGENLYQNFLWGAGKAIGSNAGTYLAWQLGDLIAGFFEGVKPGVDSKPLGVGAHWDLDIAKLVKIGMTVAGSAFGIANMMRGLGSMAGVDLEELSEELAHDVVTKGNLVSFAQAGERKTQASYVGDYSEGGVAAAAQDQTSKYVETYKDDEYNEQKEKMENISDSLGNVKEDIQFIAQLLNEDGIVVRGRTGFVNPVTELRPQSYLPQSEASNKDTTGATMIGVRAAY